MGADEELAAWFQRLPASTDGSYGACEEPPSVRIARIGELPHGGSKLSRDGSVHVTDEARRKAILAPSASADERRPQVFNTASHFVGAMLSLLGAAELIVKASEQASSARSRPACQGGWRAPRALAAAPGRRGFVEHARALWWCCAARHSA